MQQTPNRRQFLAGQQLSRPDWPGRPPPATVRTSCTSSPTSSNGRPLPDARSTDPNLDRLAKSGMLFERSYTHRQCVALRAQ